MEQRSQELHLGSRRDDAELAAPGAAEREDELVRQLGTELLLEPLEGRRALAIEPVERVDMRLEAGVTPPPAPVPVR